MTSLNPSVVPIVCSLVFSFSAQAAGPVAQGTLFSGQGLDWQRTGTASQAFAAHILSGFPLGPGSYPVNAAIIDIRNCAVSVANKFAVCTARVRQATNHPTTQFCGHWLSTGGEQRKLYAFGGHVDAHGVFVFQPSEVTLACAPNDQTKVADWEWNSMGALGKCVAWPLVGTGYGYTPANPNDFQSCIRVVRADYCGDGVSHTKESTLIDLYRANTMGTHVVEPAFLLEATWDPAGAICILHARYVSLPAACQDKFPVPLNLFPIAESQGGAKVGMRGSDYWCRRGASASRSCDADAGTCPWFGAVQAILTAGILANDSLLQP